MTNRRKQLPQRYDEHACTGKAIEMKGSCGGQDKGKEERHMIIEEAVSQ